MNVAYPKIDLIDLTNEESEPKLLLQVKESDTIDLVTDSEDIDIISDNITHKPILKSNVLRQNINSYDTKQSTCLLDCESTKRSLPSSKSSKPKQKSEIVFNIIITNEKPNQDTSGIEKSISITVPKSDHAQELDCKNLEGSDNIIEEIVSDQGISVIEKPKFVFAPKNSPVHKLNDVGISFNGFQKILPSQYLPPFPKVPQCNLKQSLKSIPPTPTVQIKNKGSRVELIWNLELNSMMEKIKNYELYAYKETNDISDTSMWIKMGDIEPLQLPIICELDEFIGGFIYYFAIRAVDIHNRCTPFAIVHTSI